MIVLDAGALIALDNGDAAMWSRIAAARDVDRDVVVPAGALAQAWRGGPRQARLARLLDGTVPAGFDTDARRAGELCGNAGTADVVDAHVALAAARPGVLVLYTSDPDDLGHLLGRIGGHRPRVVAI